MVLFSSSNIINQFCLANINPQNICQLLIYNEAHGAQLYGTLKAGICLVPCVFNEAHLKYTMANGGGWWASSRDYRCNTNHYSGYMIAREVVLNGIRRCRRLWHFLHITDAADFLAWPGTLSTCYHCDGANLGKELLHWCSNENGDVRLRQYPKKICSQSNRLFNSGMNRPHEGCANDYS